MPHSITLIRICVSVVCAFTFSRSLSLFLQCGAVCFDDGGNDNGDDDDDNDDTVAATLEKSFIAFTIFRLDRLVDFVLLPMSNNKTNRF